MNSNPSVSTKDRILDALFSDGGLFRVRAALTFLLTGATVYLFVSDNAVPDALLALTGGAVGYYFASRTV